MATVTGSLLDFGMTSLVQRSPQIAFVPSGAAAASGTILAATPVTVTPDNLGNFSVILQPTSELLADAWYTIRITVLDSAGNFTHIDFPEWKIRVPDAGGVISDLIGDATAVNASFVYWQPTEPDPWPVGTIWVNSVTGDVNRKDS